MFSTCILTAPGDCHPKRFRCIDFKSRKENENKGKWFWRCPIFRAEESCRFFLWKHEAVFWEERAKAEYAAAASAAFAAPMTPVTPAPVRTADSSVESRAVPVRSTASKKSTVTAPGRDSAATPGPSTIRPGVSRNDRHPSVAREGAAAVVVRASTRPLGDEALALSIGELSITPVCIPPTPIHHFANCKKNNTQRVTISVEPATSAPLQCLRVGCFRDANITTCTHDAVLMLVPMCAVEQVQAAIQPMLTRDRPVQSDSSSTTSSSGSRT